MYQVHYLDEETSETFNNKIVDQWPRRQENRQTKLREKLSKKMQRIQRIKKEKQI